MDRGINPHDGSRRRLKSAVHKSLKDYDRRINKQIKEVMNTYNDDDPLVKEFQESLKLYIEELKNNPNSIFYKGLVKQTEEVIEDLKLNKEKNEH